MKILLNLSKTRQLLSKRKGVKKKNLFTEEMKMKNSIRKQEKEWQLIHNMLLFLLIVNNKFK